MKNDSSGSGEQGVGEIIGNDRDEAVGSPQKP